MLRLLVLHFLFGAAWVGGFFLLPDHPSALVSALYVIGAVVSFTFGPAIIIALLD